MANTTKQWIFDDGLMKYHHPTFPFAYRAMHNSMKRGVEQGILKSQVVKRFFITSPIGKKYSFDSATDLALSTGLLTAEGIINSREFKVKKPL
jgi:hypothetical protein